MAAIARCMVIGFAFLELGAPAAFWKPETGNQKPGFQKAAVGPQFQKNKPHTLRSSLRRPQVTANSYSTPNLYKLFIFKYNYVSAFSYIKQTEVSCCWHCGRNLVCIETNPF